MSKLSIMLLLVAGVTACGGGSGSDNNTQTPTAPTPVNSVPVANAGQDVEGTVGQLIVIDGTASSDADGDTLSYAWQLTSVPAGSQVILTENTQPQVEFTPDLPGDYVLELVVNDGQADSAVDSVVVSAIAEEPENTIPVAEAGAGQQVSVGEQIILDGSASSDADNDTLTFNWTMLSRPQNSSAILNNADQVSPDFNTDVSGEYLIELVVNDGNVSSEPDNVLITAISEEPQNHPPVAVAGNDQSVSVLSLVQMDGSQSYDEDGDTLSFNWIMLSQPEESTATLQNQTSVTPSFTVDVAGQYQLSLVVNDGQVNSETSVAVVEATNTNVDITDIVLTSRNSDCSQYVGTYYSNVTDIQRGIGFNGDIDITLEGDMCVLRVNEIPNHDFNDEGANFASDVSAQSGTYQIPVAASKSQTTTALDLGTTNVIFLNGVSADLLAAACYDVGNEPLGREKIGCGQDQIDNPWRYDPMSALNNFGTDSHNAHPQPDGTYHYHGNPLALFDVDCEANATLSPVIGFAADGFPVYGPCIDDSGTIRKAESSYRLKNGGGPRQDVAGFTTPQSGVGSIASGNYDGQFRGDYEYVDTSGDLDECNGMTVNGQYGYYLTDSYPWILGCFSGDPDGSFSKTGAELENLMHDHSKLPVHHHH